MEKIAKIAGVALVTVFLAVIVLSYSAAPPKDKVDAIRAFVKISKLFADKKLIDPNKVETDTADFKYIKVWAQYLRDITDAERAVNTKRRVAKQAIQASNLSNLVAIENGFGKVRDFASVNEASRQGFYTAINRFAEGVAAIDLEDSFFSKESAINIGESESAHFDKLYSYRVAVAQFLNTALEFVKSREGLYQINGSAIVFSTEADQTYFRGLLLEMQRYDNEIDLLSNEHREDIRRELNKIFSE